MDRRLALQQWVDKWQISYNLRSGTVGLGWMPLLDELAEALISAGWNRKLDQVKEKFGGLRVYIDDDNRNILSIDQYNKLMDIIDDMEQRSYTICEDCGAPGTPRQTQWIRTLCDTCASSK